MKTSRNQCARRIHHCHFPALHKGDITALLSSAILISSLLTSALLTPVHCPTDPCT